MSEVYLIGIVFADAIQSEREEFDEEDRLEPAPEGAPPPVGGGDEYVMAPPIEDGAGITQEDIAQGLALQHQLGKSERGGPALAADGVRDMLSAHRAELELQRREQELELRSREHELEMSARKKELALKQKELELELRMIEQGGGGGDAGAGGGAAAPAPAPEPQVEQRNFILLVSSEDEELLPEQRKCTVSAGTVAQLEGAVQEKLGLGAEVALLTWDSDFEEFVLLSKLGDLKAKAKVQIKRKDD